MTQPAPPPQQQTTAQQKTAVLAGLLASTVPAAGLVAGFATVAAIPRPMAERLIEQTPSVRMLAQGPVARAVAAAEPTYRAAYLLAAAQRVRDAVASGKTLEEALAAEQRHTVAHLNAQTNRARAAAAVDKAAVTHRSGLLGWKARMDSRTSAECRAADRKNFSIFAPPAIGLPGSVHPHCFPAGVLVSGPRAVASTTRWYEGEIVELHTLSGAILPVTPNHPVLTMQGWIAAGLLVEGSEVIRQGLTQGPVVRDPHNDQQPSCIEDVAVSVGSADAMASARVPVTAEDFHGDGVGSEIAVVRADGLLRHDGYLAFVEPPRELLLTGAAVGSGRLAGGSDAFAVEERLWPSSDGIVGGGDVARALFGSAASLFETVGFDDAAPLNLRLVKPPVDGLSGDAVFGGESLDGPSVAVTRHDEIVGWVDPVVRRSVRLAACHVYNLQTTTGWYVANGIVVHNCRCRPVAAFAGAGMVGEAARATAVA